jgi:hypothetical protein
MDELEATDAFRNGSDELASTQTVGRYQGNGGDIRGS